MSRQGLFGTVARESLKNHDKSASGAGGADHRYWDSCRSRSPPRRKRNAEVRAREYLTDGEIARLITAAGENRHSHRDATAVLVAYRHGLRAAELVTLRWDAIDFAHGRLHVRRAKGGSDRSTRCPAASCGRYAGSSATRSQRRRLSLRPSAAHRSRPQAFVR